MVSGGVSKLSFFDVDLAAAKTSQCLALKAKIPERISEGKGFPSWVLTSLPQLEPLSGQIVVDKGSCTIGAASQLSPGELLKVPEAGLGCLSQLGAAASHLGQSHFRYSHIMF